MIFTPGDKKFEDQVSENTELFKLEDVNGNGVLKDQIDLTETREAYFVYDKTGPTVPDNVTYSRPAAEKAQFTWTNPSDVDFWKAEIYTQDITGNTTLQSWNASLTPQLFTKDTSTFNRR